MPYCCQRRNQGLWASSSSCLRFAAERSLGLNGRWSGCAKSRSRRSISSMVCSASIHPNIQHEHGNRQPEGYGSRLVRIEAALDRGWIATVEVRSSSLLVPTISFNGLAASSLKTSTDALHRLESSWQTSS